MDVKIAINGEPTTLGGNLHAILSQTGFFAMIIGMMIFARVIYHDPAWCGFTYLSLAVVGLELMVYFPFTLDTAESVEGAL